MGRCLPAVSLAELPERRRETLLWQVAFWLDYDELDAVVRERSQEPCLIWPPTRVERVAVLGDDGRYHLRVDGQLHCDPRDGSRGHRHRHWCVWWADHRGYRIQPPTGAKSGDGRGGQRTVRWKVTLTDRVADPTQVPISHRCPVDVDVGPWPPYENLSTPKGRVRAALIELAGPNCHACGAMPGVFIDHDHFTGLVRGLLCRGCNSSVDGCPHLTGCRWADYLENPPGATLQRRYPGHDATIRNARSKIAFLGLDPFLRE